MKFTFYFFLSVIPFFADAQEKKTPYTNIAGLSAGRSRHGSGDINGFIFTTEYSRYIKKSFSLGVSISGTIHDGSSPLFFTGSGRSIDGSIRYTVAGFQLSPTVGYSFVKTPRHEILARLGGLLRYQSSSLPDDFIIYYPAFTGLPFPVIVFNHTTPLRTFTIGATGQLFYYFNVTEKIFAGVIAGFQFDSGGDNISQVGICTGIRF